MEVVAVWEHPIHVGHPVVHLHLGAHRTEAAFAGSGDATGFSWMVRASIGVEPEAVRLSTVHDLPDVVGDEPSDSYPIDGKELFPVVLEDFLQLLHNCR